MERTRTFSWQDPMISAEAAKNLSGLQFMQAIQRGELPPPPIANLIDMDISEVEKGRCVFSLRPAEFHYNPIGSVHGGIFCTLLDSAMGCAVQTSLPAGSGYTTLELKVNLVRPLTAKTGQVFCEGKVIYGGGRVATAEGRIYDEEGKLYGHATTTCLIFR